MGRAAPLHHRPAHRPALAHPHGKPAPHHSPHHHAPPALDRGRPARLPLGPVLALMFFVIGLAWTLGLAQKIPTPINAGRARAATAGRIVSPTQARARLGDRDGDGIPDSREDVLLSRYAPNAMVAADDASLPANVDWVRARTGWNLSTPQLGGLLVPPRRIDDATRKGSTDPRDWTMYGHAYPRAGGGIVLQYWLYFPFNKAPIVFFDHEGDWEHVSVELDENDEPVSFDLSRHGNNAPGVKVAWKDVPREGDHPWYLVAWGSHAAYLKPSEAPPWERVVDCPRNADGTPRVDGCPVLVWRAGEGRTSPLVNVGERTAPRLEGDRDGFFMRYAGLWGEAAMLDFMSAAPPGPPYQRGFCADSDGTGCL